jgi:hypothetical protein
MRTACSIIIGGCVLIFAGVALGDETTPPRFSRHVQAVFSRLGCNGGACHGAVQGKNGFRLSLFAADAKFDYDEVVRDERGRRLNRVDPDNSLLLLKATAAVPHQGGVRTAVGSPDYNVLRAWIAGGATIDAIDDSRATRLEVTPRESLGKIGASYVLQVQATFADGSREDVTALASFSSLDEMVATVDANGRVTATGVGDAALIVRYRAEPVMAMIAVPRESSDPFPDVAANNFVDEQVHAKLKRLNLPPAELCDDSTFLRRVRLDVTGRLPAPDEVRTFVADSDPNKRAKKIDELLADDGYAALWALKFCDILKATDFGVYADSIEEHFEAPRFHAWVRARMKENTPYDEFVERILTATSREGRSLDDWSKEVIALQEGYGTPRTDLEVYAKRRTLDAWWQRKEAIGVKGAMQVAHAFLGLRLECAQCHRHPHDVWQQDDLLSFANYFTHVRRIGFEGDNEKNFPDEAVLFKRFMDEGKQLDEEVKKLKEQKAPEDQVKKTERRAHMLKEEVSKRILHGEVKHMPKENWAFVESPLGSQKSDHYRLLGSKENATVAADQDPRPLVAAWVRAKENPYFARAMVNRVWAHYFGRGIINPPDDLSSFNPPTHPELLEKLCSGFVENRYDLKWLHRTILASRTYQQSSAAPAASAADRSNYAYFYVRRMPAEVLVDALNDATGTTEKFDMSYWHWPEGLRTIDIPYRPRNDFVNFMLDQFGRPARNSAVQCDCERGGDASVLQVLTLASHPHVQEKIASPEGHAARLAKDVPECEKQIEELYLLTLGRSPTDDERAVCASYIEGSESPEKGLQGVLWSLLNTREFVLQH